MLVEAVWERGGSGSKLFARSALAVTMPGAAALWEATAWTSKSTPLDRHQPG